MKKPQNLPDTNFILRYLLRDVEHQFIEANTFFESVRTGKLSAVIKESVLIECLYILMKYYKVSRFDITLNLTQLLQYKGIAGDGKDIMLKALAIFSESTLDPVDCFLAAEAEITGCSVLTFDKSLKKRCGFPAT